MDRQLADHKRSHSLYNLPWPQGLEQIETSTGKVAQKLSFASPSESLGQDYEPLTLPKIDPYVPSGTDPDAATALTALYRSQCTSLVDAIRFVKQKTFFHLFTSFHGTLTLPVQKLFTHPSVAAWIEECDFLMYQKMMHVVAHLTLEVVPQAVLDILQEISSRLVPHIQNSFSGQPSHVIQAKVTPATLFAGLLDRMCRVNLTAHACANMLSHPPNRDQMYQDFITMVRLRKVAETVPAKAMDGVVMLILSQLRDLLDPTDVPWSIEAATPFGEIATRDGRRESSAQAGATTTNVLDRWVNFLASLTEKFPNASAEDIVQYVETIGTAVMRDLTIKSGASFGAWWVTKCWIDEMISFMAEKGGFMNYNTIRKREREAFAASRPMTTMDLPGVPQGHLQGNFMNIQSPDKPAVSIPGPMEARNQDTNSLANYDDSGIAMRSPEDDYMMNKFGFNEMHAGGVPPQGLGAA
jgi:regulatory factor X